LKPNTPDERRFARIVKDRIRRARKRLREMSTHRQYKAFLEEELGWLRRNKIDIAWLTERRRVGKGRSQKAREKEVTNG